MNISAINGIDRIGGIYADKVNNINNNSDNKVSFESVFQSAIGLVNETNGLANKAEDDEIKFAMGTSDSIVDLMVAHQKANLSLQYTVAVKNTVLDAYKELMNLQF